MPTARPHLRYESTQVTTRKSINKINKTSIEILVMKKLDYVKSTIRVPISVLAPVATVFVVTPTMALAQTESHRTRKSHRTISTRKSRIERYPPLILLKIL